MAFRKVQFAEGEFYHIYNRGVDKRPIFGNKNDIERFFQSMNEFNTEEPIGSIYEHFFVKKDKLGSEASKLVNFICYCLNPNHYHFILEQVLDRGIEKFMQRLGTGYTKYFNNKYKRTGGLFQGVFKSAHVNSNEYLLHLSAYVNLNYKAHKIENNKKILFLSSWSEYLKGKTNNFCKKDIIIDQFKDRKKYQKFAENSLIEIIKKKNQDREDNKKDKEIETMLLE